MEDNKVSKLVYTFFLGVLIAFFVGIGINTFYQPPEPPKFPVELNYNAGKDQEEKQILLQKNYDRKKEDFNKNKMNPYNRNVSIITLTSAVTLLALSIVFEKKMKLIADGVMLGGLFTLLYSLGRGLASQYSKYVFAMVSIGLAVVLYLGYHRFVKKQTRPVKEAK